MNSPIDQVLSRVATRRTIEKSQPRFAGFARNGQVKVWTVGTIAFSQSTVLHERDNTHLFRAKFHSHLAKQFRASLSLPPLHQLFDTHP